MSLIYLALGKKRNTIRDIARNHYLANGGDKEKSIQAAVDELKTGSIIATILLGIAIKLITELIIYWIENLVSIPQQGYSKGEPGYE